MESTTKPRKLGTDAARAVGVARSGAIGAVAAR